MIATKIRENIYWVGAIDWDLRSFHGYSTDKGSTYNAYLILDEKITLIDNVKVGFTDELVQRISSVIDPSKIEVIISNHGEPDHSGSLKHILSLAPNAKVYSAHPNGVKILNAQYGDDLPLIPVKNGDTLSIGKRTLQFVHAPMVHWPDNMVTYIPEEKILFSNDIFGQHLATSKRFDGEVDLDLCLTEAKKYYANIVLPYTNQAFKIATVAKGLDIEMIATSHGIIWRDHIPAIMELYEKMTTSNKQEKAVVVYDTMWGSTAKMAKSIAEGFAEAGVAVSVYNVNDTHASDIITEVMNAKYIAVGSPTFNNTILPEMASFLCYLKGLSPIGMKYVSFGSYGWGGQSVKIIDEELASLKFEQLIPIVKHQYFPTNDDLNNVKKQVKSALK